MAQTPDQNSLAYLLSNELQKTTEKFKKAHPFLSINGIMGAANIFLATWHVNAPTRTEALETLEQNFELIRNLINNTPEAFFGGKTPNLN